jgi:hydroxymethylbilane synthase
MKDRLVIGSRGSKLALVQAESVRSHLSKLNPSCNITIEIVKTSGDANSQPLSVIGGKGVFTKELEDALLSERIDVAVHSLKDLPTELPGGLAISAICEREDPRDALVFAKDFSGKCSIDDLREGAVVGTSSPRRLAQLKHLRPDVQIKELRGNVDTRLRKLDEGQYDALILAAAGLRRLGLSERICAPIDIELMLPAVGQGALGIETRADDAEVIPIVEHLNHEPTKLACLAERALLRELGGGCQLPIAAYATIDERGNLHLTGLVTTVDGNQIVKRSIEGPQADAERLGTELAHSLLEAGASRLLSQLN